MSYNIFARDRNRLSPKMQYREANPGDPEDDSSVFPGTSERCCVA